MQTDPRTEVIDECYFVVIRSNWFTKNFLDAGTILAILKDKQYIHK